LTVGGKFKKDKTVQRTNLLLTKIKINVMKKSILFLIVQLISLEIFSQIALEHTYNNTGYYMPSSSVNGTAGNGLQKFYLVHLEIDGDKYVKIDKPAQTIDFYNLNHQLWKSINYSNVTTNIGPNSTYDKSGCSILYISQSLFDTDAEIEFMYTYWWGGSTDNPAITQIVNENGSILFTDLGAPIVSPTFHNQFFPIYNTTNGTKMILSNVNGTAEVFSLGGNFTAGISQNNIVGNAEMTLFPNPSTGGNMITINYKLPEENKTGNMIVFDSQGKQVKSYKIGNGMTDILINPAELSKGTYFYSIITDEGKVIATQKSILIE
jgi:hypothetical protein